MAACVVVVLQADAELRWWCECSSACVSECGAAFGGCCFGRSRLPAPRTASQSEARQGLERGVES